MPGLLWTTLTWSRDSYVKDNPRWAGAPPRSCAPPSYSPKQLAFRLTGYVPSLLTQLIQANTSTSCRDRRLTTTRRAQKREKIGSPERALRPDLSIRVSRHVRLGSFRCVSSFADPLSCYFSDILSTTKTSFSKHSEASRKEGTEGPTGLFACFVTIRSISSFYSPSLFLPFL